MSKTSVSTTNNMPTALPETVRAANDILITQHMDPRPQDNMISIPLYDCLGDDAQRYIRNAGSFAGVRIYVNDSDVVVSFHPVTIGIHTDMEYRLKVISILQEALWLHESLRLPVANYQSSRVMLSGSKAGKLPPPLPSRIPRKPIKQASASSSRSKSFSFSTGDSDEFLPVRLDASLAFRKYKLPPMLPAPTKPLPALPLHRQTSVAPRGLAAMVQGFNTPSPSPARKATCSPEWQILHNYERARKPVQVEQVRSVHARYALRDDAALDLLFRK